DLIRGSWNDGGGSWNDGGDRAMTQIRKQFIPVLLAQGSSRVLFCFLWYLKMLQAKQERQDS
ncbi:MAG: hypothetical protein CVV37_08295, partial [Nitrospira bacterium HGW-Nitrospira-1]